jgi:hypothetical protein
MDRLCLKSDSCIVTALNPPLFGTPPELYTKSLVPFEKGYLFLKYIEKILNETKPVPKEEVTLFMNFTINFLKTLQMNTQRDRVSSSNFRDNLVSFLREEFKNDIKSNIETRKKIQWSSWLKLKNNLPMAPPSSDTYLKIIGLARQHFVNVFLRNETSLPNKTIGFIFNQYSVAEKKVFLSAYATFDQFAHYSQEYLYNYFVAHLQPVLLVEEVIDIEFLTIWFVILIKYTPATHLLNNNMLFEYLSFNGREDYLVGIFSQLESSAQCKLGIYELATKILETNQNFFHQRVQQYIRSSINEISRLRNSTNQQTCSLNGFPTKSS